MNQMQEDQVFRELSDLRIENQELKRLCDMDKVQRIQELEETIERMSEDAKGITVRAARIFASNAFVESAVKVHGALSESQEKHLEFVGCRDCAESLFGQCDRHRSK